MIQMSVGDEDMAEAPLFGDRERARDCARIDGHAAIDEKRGHPAFGAIAPKAPEDPKFHALSIPGPARLP